MPKKTSAQVMRSRRNNSDRISFVVPKDAHHLLHVQAKKESVTAAEMIRRAILARCGLEAWPDENTCIQLTECKNRAAARRIMAQLQREEYARENNRFHVQTDTGGITIRDNYTALLLADQRMKDEYIDALKRLLYAVQNAAIAQPGEDITPMRIKFDKKRLAAIRRLLANIDENPQADDYEEDEN